jgi:hypothetical protein
MIDKQIPFQCYQYVTADYGEDTQCHKLLEKTVIGIRKEIYSKGIEYVWALLDDGNDIPIQIISYTPEQALEKYIKQTTIQIKEIEDGIEFRKLENLHWEKQQQRFKKILNTIKDETTRKN